MKQVFIKLNEIYLLFICLIINKLRELKQDECKIRWKIESKLKI